MEELEKKDQNTAHYENLEQVLLNAEKTAETLWLQQLLPAINSLQIPRQQLERIAEIQIQLQQNIAPILTYWQQWYASFAPLAQAVLNWQQQMIPMLQKLQPVLSQLGEYLQSWQQYIEDEKEVAEAFKNGHLLLAPSMPLSLVKEVTALCKTGEFRKASRLIGAYYRNNGYSALQNVVGKWSENRYFKSRMGIILDALEAHTQRKYTLSIPALLPQIEGIASDIAKKGSTPAPNKLKARLGKTKFIVSQVIEESKQPFGHAMHDILLAFIEEPLYKSRDFEKDYRLIKKHTGLSRHGILHGLQTKYPAYTNSLRIFLVLDILFYIAEDLENK